MSKVKIRRAKQDQPVIINQVNIRPSNRNVQEITTWKTAIQSAENGRRVALYNCYDYILQDPRLSSVAEKRVLAITNSDWYYTDKDGKEVPEITDLIDSPGFEKMLEEIQNRLLYGHTLLELSRNPDGSLNTELIPRKHVKSEIGVVAFNEQDLTGIEYRNPPYNYYLVEVGSPRGDFGLLLKAAPYVIFKNGNMSDWAQYAEVFGMPMRIGKYDMEDLEGKAAMEQSLEGAGSASWLAIPKNTDIDFKEAKGTGDGKLYENLKNACNEEITILFLGQNMTTEDGSSKAQGQVHMMVEESLHKKDRRNVRRILNKQVKQALMNLGYPISEDGKFGVREENKLSIKERIEILNMVKSNTPVSDDEYYTTSGVPKPDNYDELKKQANKPTDPVPPTDPASGNKPNGKKEVVPNKKKLSIKKIGHLFLMSIS